MKTKRKRKPRPKRSVFLKGAELLHSYMLEGSEYQFCCYAFEKQGYFRGSPEVTMFREYFQGEYFDMAGLWWPMIVKDGLHYHDYESRILAMLLCAEMCRR